MDDQRVDRESGGSVNDATLQLTPFSVLFIIVFAVIHFVIGCALVFAWLDSWPPLAAYGRVLVNIWWFPGQQLIQLHHSEKFASNLALPIANSLLWGAAVFVIWKARKGQYLRFSLRTLLIAATVIAALLGAFMWLEK
jgi:hypothetical protein